MKREKKVIRWSLKASCWRESISLNIYWVFTIKRRYVLEQKKISIIVSEAFVKVGRNKVLH